jgi:signal transduction histidine kinase
MSLGPALSVLVPAVALALAGATLALWLERVRLRRELAACRHGRDAALDAREMLVRRLQLAAHDVRGAGMSVHGHADHLAASGHDDAHGLAVAAADLVDLADDLQDLTLEAAAPRVLRDEELVLGEVVNEAVARIAATILPGRRNFRVLPELRLVVLRADRRALGHALGRILADAVRNTRHDDWIDISAHRTTGALILSISDEGKGIQASGTSAARRDSRGIGLRLALVRALIEAHGGHVDVEGATEIGSRVSIALPASRLAALNPPLRSCAAPEPADGSAGR